MRKLTRNQLIESFWISELSRSTRFFATCISGSGDLSIESNRGAKFPSASMIKAYLLALICEDTESGKLSWTDLVRAKGDLEAGGDGVLRFLSDDLALSVRDLCVLMIGLSDNTASNLLIAELGGPDAVNQRLQATGSSARLRGWFSGKGVESSDADRLLADTQIIGPPGVGLVDAGDFHDFLLRSGGVWRKWFLNSEPALRWQHDRRSLARYVSEEVDFPHKTGTVRGFRHDAGVLRFGDDELRIAVLTESQESDEYVDHPACRAMGTALAWTMHALGAEDSLVAGSPAPPAILLSSLSFVDARWIYGYFEQEKVSELLRNQERELIFWKQQRAHRFPSAWTVVDSGEPVGVACLYPGRDLQEMAVGIYIFDESNHRKGIGAAVGRMLIEICRSRGVSQLNWTCVSSNEASQCLAKHLGFTYTETVAGFRQVPSGSKDEVRFVLRPQDALLH